MFLNTLKLEEKIKFVQFVYQVANADGSYADEERGILQNYLAEMQMEEMPEMKDSLDDIIIFFSEKNEEVKKLVLFEVFGLVISDEVVAKEEEEILLKLEKLFELSKETVAEIKALVFELKAVYDKIYTILA